MKNNISRKLLFISLALAFITISSSIIINLLTGQEGFKVWLGANGVGTKKLVAGTIAIGIALLLFTYLHLKYSLPAKPLTDSIEPNVKGLFDSLQERYQYRYQSKLDGRFEITLEVSECFDSQHPQKFIERYALDAKVSAAFTAISSAFEKQGRLLIVGSPGVGKTVLLLKLALNLLAKTDLAKQEAFPVIFNLASWSEEYKDFEDWLITTLVSSNGLSKEFAATLLQQERIIFLLDGLDELARNETKEYAHYQRAACLASLNDYLRRNRQAVICCRREEFIQMQKETGQDAPVSAKIEVLDLTKAEIALALLHAHADKISRAAANNLLSVIQTSETFLEVLSTPFYFTTALEVFDKELWTEKDFPRNVDTLIVPLHGGQLRLWPDMGFPRDVAVLKKYLLKRFVEHKLKHATNPNNFPPAKTIKWLTWLANKLDKDGLIQFELSSLHLLEFEKVSRPLLSYGAGDMYVNWIVCIFLMNILGVWNGLLGFSIYVTVSSITNRIGPSIETEDTVSLELTRFFKQDVWEEKFFSMRFLSPFSLGHSFLAGIFLLAYFYLRWSFISWILVAAIALSFIPTGIIVCLMAGILNTSFERLKKIKEFTNLEYPYQRLWGGFSINLVFSLFVVLLFSINFGLFEGYVKKDFFLYDEIQLVLVLFPLSFLIAKLLSSPLVRHLLLRIDLYRDDKMPLKYATFLDYAASLRILEKDGGHWRFRHQNLQEHFVTLGASIESNKQRKSIIGLIKKIALNLQRRLH